MPRDELGVLSEIKRSTILRQIKSQKRNDGRDLNTFRPITVQTGFVTKAPGSAMVQIGKTRVLAGVKIEEGEPFPDTPNQGVLTTNVELLPMAFPTFESGPPNENAIELARVVDRGIRESKMIDLKGLVIEPAKKVWIVFIDIDVLDFDGNLIDACSLASVAALKTAIVPGSTIGQKDFQLPITCTPVSVTFVDIDGTLVPDPDLEEEQVSGARITVTTSEDGKLRAMQKGSVGSLSMDQIKGAISMSFNLGKELREKYLR
ncbi:MAG: exosome complex protein Rrp42 [Candidatus Thermoplasmatota archaeon]|jgi:exosome complex component RRP42|nr:exosome complex protein Rrp42 [Candidatus Thermoplasmatota archaeon]MCL5785939.1 exosome complex protein Rrp42 [Candidatus Thermoplasmatota archaeon]